MELYELWWRALDPCCCLAFLSWFHASFIIHFHTKQTTLSVSAMGTSVSRSLFLSLSEMSCATSFSTCCLPPLLHYTFNPIFNLLIRPFLPRLLALPCLPFLLLPAVGWLYHKSLQLFPINILLQQPVRHQQSPVLLTVWLIVLFSHVHMFSFSSLVDPFYFLWVELKVMDV